MTIGIGSCGLTVAGGAGFGINSTNTLQATAGRARHNRGQRRCHYGAPREKAGRILHHQPRLDRGRGRGRSRQPYHDSRQRFFRHSCISLFMPKAVR